MTISRWRLRLLRIGRWVGNGLKILDLAFNWLCLSKRVETFSRRAGRARHQRKRWGCVVCAVLNPVARLVRRALGMPADEPDHCEAARLAPEIV